MGSQSDHGSYSQASTNPRVNPKPRHDRLELARVETPDLWSARERGFFALAALIERCQSNGWAPGRDTLDVLATTWGFVHGFVDLWVGGPLQAPYDGNELVPTLRRVLNDLLDGFGPATS